VAVTHPRKAVQVQLLPDALRRQCRAIMHSPSPLYSGERVGVRGPSLRKRHPPSPRPSPPSTGEREQSGHRAALAAQLLIMARSSIGERTPAPQAGGMGSIPIRAIVWPSGGTGRHATLRTSSPNRRGSSTLPLVTAEWTGAWLPARSHKPFDAGSNPASANVWRVVSGEWRENWEKTEVRDRQSDPLTSDF
jgi:hypothetical protein